MTVEFVKNVGFRLFNKGKSMIMETASVGRPGATLTDKEILQYGIAVSIYLDGASGRGELSYRSTRITPAQAPHSLADDVAFKFTDDDGLRYWVNGNIKLSPPSTYLTIENQHAMDKREGMAHVHLRGPERFMTMSATSGFNSAIICTSSDARKSERSLRHQKFGSRLLKINGVSEFAAKVAEMSGAERYAVRDVVYSDVKVVTGDSDFPEKFASINGVGDLRDNTMEIIAHEHLDELIVASEAAALFTKPIQYWLERERRLQFVFGADVMGPIFCKDATLAKHVEVVT
ncbi:hypothetical protein OIU34_27930 [Pararhizobium sp. BT-229]|uniref:hypothetical protein n=1 Tax=Pararhizobium sp. BT-229 TaxID=2986923 RepID=UPI0021F7319E|nr:hypothetical protein [Pararhizobium sp. BT-229]MCV9965704.1 hypothetical protein [Pararhizobium sp. BT-229]